MLIVAGLAVAWAPAPTARVALAAAVAVLAVQSWALALAALAVAAVAAWRSGGRGRGLAGWTSLALGAVAVKQVVAASALPAASSRLPDALLLVVAALAGAVVAAIDRPGAGHRRALAAGLGLFGMVAAGQLGWAWAAPTAAERLVRAERAGAVPLFYAGLVQRGRGGGCALVLDNACPPDSALLEALVVALPNRDEAALALGWARALELGWRPQRADGQAVEVARALEARGRGGEAYRILSRHSREGEVDGFMSMMERVEGAPVHWRGGQLGAVLPGTVELARELATNGEVTVEFTAAGELGDGTLTLEGSSFEGAPRVTVRLDARPAVELEVDGARSVALGPLEAGPHRLVVRFDDDRVGAGGDRNVVVRRLAAH